MVYQKKYPRTCTGCNRFLEKEYFWTSYTKCKACVSLLREKNGTYKRKYYANRRENDRANKKKDKKALKSPKKIEEMLEYSIEYLLQSLDQ